MEFDLHNSVLQVVALDTQSITTATTTVGNIIDTNTDGGFESVEFIVSAGSLNAGDFTVILEDGDDSGLSDAAVIDSELVLGALPKILNAEADTAERVGTITKKRFVRLSLLSDNTPSGANTLGAVAVLSNARTRPTPAVVTP